MPKLHPLSQLFVWNDIVWIGNTTRSWAVIVNVISVIGLRENCFILRRKWKIVPLFDPVKLLTNLNYLKQNKENFPFVNYKIIAWEETTRKIPVEVVSRSFFKGTSMNRSNCYIWPNANFDCNFHSLLIRELKVREGERVRVCFLRQSPHA